MFRKVLVYAFVLAAVSISYQLGRSASVLSSSACPNGGDVTFVPLFGKSAASSEVASSFHDTTLPPPVSFLDNWQTQSVIVTISMGNATSTKLLERLVYSLRKSGQWQGMIFVLTDQALDYQRRLQAMFQNQLYYMDRIIVLQAKPEHLHPSAPKTGLPLDFITDAQRYKRFKTLILDYLDDYYHYELSTDAVLPPYQHVMYLDVEIVVTRPIVGLLQDYLEQMVAQDVFVNMYGDINTTTVESSSTSNTTFSFQSHFSDCPKCARHNFNLNGGVFVLHYRYSRGCLAEWQSLFAQGATYVKYDQRYLSVMKASRTCHFYQLPDQHRLYPSRKDMRLKVSRTIVHNTNTYQAKRIPQHVQHAYFVYLMGNTTYFSAADDHTETF